MFDPDPSQVSIRPAVEADIDAIAAVHAAGWEQAFAGVLPPGLTPSAAQIGRRQREAFRDRNRTWAVVEVAGEVRGFVVFGPSRDPRASSEVGEIYVLFVDPRAWRRGLGAALVRHVLADLRERGHRSVTLWSARDNVRANAFYASLGFVRDGAVQQRVELGDVEEVRFRRAV